MASTRLIYALYNGARFVVAGTPSGVTLATEGGAHQSTITPSIGLELPHLTYAEPCFARALDWLLCDGIRRLAEPDGDSLYLRLSTRPVDQAPFESLVAGRGPDELRADVLAGGYRLCEPVDRAADVIIAACGAVVPEAIAAAEACAEEGLACVVLDITSADRLYREWRATLQRAAAARRGGVVGDPPRAADPPRGAQPADRHGPRRARATRCRGWEASSVRAPFPSGSTRSASRVRSTTCTAPSTSSPSRS